MSIKLGNSNITLKVGSSAVTAAYLGSTQVYPQGEPPTPTYQWVSYASGDTVPTATTVYGVRIYPLYDSNYNVTFSGSNGDYIRLYPDGFSDWAAVDENGTPINISSFRIRPGYAEYEIPFSDLGMGGMNIISPTTIFKDDIDLYVTN